eukprot:GHVU01142566.1.p1 GENE.GHVU01142566.1~~GHVU01142566.1.p1  ORF type:complete len:143 (-),score=1.99 GHVU01142566.1:709-1137(-)
MGPVESGLPTGRPYSSRSCIHPSLPLSLCLPYLHILQEMNMNYDTLYIPTIYVNETAWRMHRFLSTQASSNRAIHQRSNATVIPFLLQKMTCMHASRVRESCPCTYIGVSVAINQSMNQCVTAFMHGRMDCNILMTCIVVSK